jgi:hypothetical protein
MKIGFFENGILLILGMVTFCHSAPSWLNGRHVKSISVNECANCSNSYISVSTDEPILDPKRCGNTDTYIVNETDPAKMNRALTLLLTALSTGNPVNLFLDDGACSYSSRPIISSNILISK